MYYPVSCDKEDTISSLRILALPALISGAENVYAHILG